LIQPESLFKRLVIFINPEYLIKEVIFID